MKNKILVYSKKEEDGAKLMRELRDCNRKDIIGEFNGEKEVYFTLFDGTMVSNSLNSFNNGITQVFYSEEISDEEKEMLLSMRAEGIIEGLEEFFFNKI